MPRTTPNGPDAPPGSAGDEPGTRVADSHPAPPAPVAARVVPAPSAPPVLRSAELLGRGREVQIEHNGTRYRLRITANDKLILTK